MEFGAKEHLLLEETYQSEDVTSEKQLINQLLTKANELGIINSILNAELRVQRQRELIREEKALLNQQRKIERQIRKENKHCLLPASDFVLPKWLAIRRFSPLGVEVLQLQSWIGHNIQPEA